MAGSTIALASQRTIRRSHEGALTMTRGQAQPWHACLASFSSKCSRTIWNYRPRTSQSVTVGPIARVRVTAKLRFCCWNISYSLIGHYIIYYLVGGWPTPLKKKSSVGMIIPDTCKNKTCSKPPNRLYVCIYYIIYIGDYRCCSRSV